MEERREFVRQALSEDVNRRELCREFEISAQTGYKWLRRWRSGDEALAERSRRPHESPSRSSQALEAQVLAARDAHPAWGARKLRRWLEDRGVAVPAASTVHEILRRHGRIAPLGPSADRAQLRFERPAPNDLWQMDFKGWITLAGGERCHPLTIVDDHSRFAACLKACADQKSETVQAQLTASFRRHGLPEAIFVDNGSPWGDASGERWTRLGVWLLKLGVDLIYARPYHPQSRGKNERFHRSLKAEVLAQRRFRSFEELQRAFDAWRELYNYERPHEALELATPFSRWRRSPRKMPKQTPSVEYDAGETLRTVSSTKAYVSFKGRLYKVPQAFRRERVAIRPLSVDGRYGVFFASRQIAIIDLTDSKSVSDVSEQVSAMSPG
jgi:transposase InsO family protein